MISLNHSKMADKFEALEQQLEMFIENTRQLGIIVGDFQPQGQPVLNQKLYVILVIFTLTGINYLMHFLKSTCYRSKNDVNVCMYMYMYMYVYTVL